jgi:hypothetical protein
MRHYTRRATGGTVARRLGMENEQGVLYVLRLFGVRTVILGAELLFLIDERLEWSVRMAPVIHATDTALAAGAGYRPSFFWKMYDAVAEKIDRRVGWDRLPVRWESRF